MQLPGLPSCLFLIYLLLCIPWMTIRSASRVDRHLEHDLKSSTTARERIWIGTAFHLLMLLVMAWIVGNGFGFQPLFYPGYSSRSLGIACIGFAWIQAMVYVLRNTVSEKTRRESVIFRLMPQNRREWTYKIVAISMASIAEEVAYRGVGYQILAYSLNGTWLAMVICSVAFALAHWMQGWRSMLVLFGFAMVLHGVVWATNTLLYAVVIHLVHNLLAVRRLSRDASADRAMPY